MNTGDDPTIQEIKELFDRHSFDNLIEGALLERWYELCGSIYNVLELVEKVHPSSLQLERFLGEWIEDRGLPHPLDAKTLKRLRDLLPRGSRGSLILAQHMLSHSEDVSETDESPALEKTA